ncbi:F-box domain protein [Paraphoma chrysanthemicola]|uniref:F-box domain protein n=1 Tax=Paraphoma chrysanthemicola TaxID=798071 RepID=A0A8K0VWC0_9PLEO|nr:F-box domain protein [Paraphoma chrysanthemicola]
MGNERTWALLRRMAANFTDLEQIDINRECWNLYLTPIFRWLACPKLKLLKVHGISGWKEHGNVELEAEKFRTASFTTLHISEYEETPEATRLLLQWPAKLTELNFESFYSNPHIMDYPMFESWLYIHRETLVHLSIGYLSRAGSRRLFNATLFPNLTYLKLSRWQMDEPVHFSGDSSQDANILGPALTTFAWDFSIYDQHSEGWSDFGDAEADWLRGLGDTAVAKKAPLNKIEIVFTPDRCWSATEEMGYPWDRMDALRDVHLKPKGIGLVYNEPSISKDEWLKYVRMRIFRGWRDDGTQVVDSGAGEEQDGSGRESADDDEEVVSSLDDDSSCGYQGEDIRKYFAKQAKRV